MRPPDFGAAAGWAGAAVDPETGMLYIPSRNIAVGHPALHPPTRTSAPRCSTHTGRRKSVACAQIREGQSYQARMPQGLPLLKPPYSRITAIDMNTGEHAWMVPLGNGDRIRNHPPRLRHLNLPPLGDGTIGGPLLTKTLLISTVPTAGSRGGPGPSWPGTSRRARSAARSTCPPAPSATPMTYLGRRAAVHRGQHRGRGRGS